MAYVIHYGPVKKQRVWRKPKLFRAGVAVAGIVVVALIPSVRSWVWDLIVPGDPKVTTQAFSELINDIRGGETVTAAIEGFCSQILAHG